MAIITVELKGIVVCFKFEERVFFMKNILISESWIKVGVPGRDLRNDVQKYPRKYHPLISQTVLNWTNEDLDKIETLLTDNDLVLDMKKDFLDEGYTILKEELD